MEIKITESKFRQIVAEELNALKEDVDHEGVKKVVTAASKLLKACSAFNEGEPTAQMVNAVTPHLGSLIKVLEAMINTPASYVTAAVKPKKKKVVKLRSTLGEQVSFDNFQQLKVGTKYKCGMGAESTTAIFNGWVGSNGQLTESEDVKQVNLLFADADDGMTWSASWNDAKGCYSSASSADPLYVKEQ